ncbi:DUF3261 domain-containing protein [Agarivorans sp. TSD2052]|uniref:DUF3261 domain-containing protein n=1 Tax=Agarivorans sp. TSD2052 TaxID=2937286 RepID=UPI00200FB877|nr:DUF3261 domain-containing protein [Agarivorans sp. TSD2052]UPW19349.1 DUF3261 domain-containing protein [Agarivorans sp. TSD2052]
MRGIVVILLLAFVSACSQLVPEPVAQARALLIPSDLGYSVNAQQVARFQTDVQNQQFIFDLKVSSQLIELIALDGFSTPLFKISFDGQKLLEHTFVPSIDAGMAQFILADLQLAYWPVKVLNQQLKADGWRVEEFSCEQAVRCRQVYWQEKPVSQVVFETDDPWKGNVTLINRLANYQIDISTLEVLQQ